MLEKKITNRPYYYYSLRPIASFSCKTLTQVSCLVRLNITLLLGLGSTRYYFVSENIGIQPSSVLNILKYVNIETMLAGKNE